MANDDLVRVESAVTATASGNLTWEKWPLDCAVALGLAGQHNPLGFAVVRYLSDAPTAGAVFGVVLILAKEMERRGVRDADIHSLARQAFEYWRDRRCPACSGRGVRDIEQHQCPACNGTGERQSVVGPEAVRVGFSALLEAESWMEGQLRARLKRG